MTSRDHPTLDSAHPQLTAARWRHPDWFLGWCGSTGEYVALPFPTAPQRTPPWVADADLAALEDQLNVVASAGG